MPDEPEPKLEEPPLLPQHPKSVVVAASSPDPIEQTESFWRRLWKVYLPLFATHAAMIAFGAYMGARYVKKLQSAAPNPAAESSSNHPANVHREEVQEKREATEDTYLFPDMSFEPFLAEHHGNDIFLAPFTETTSSDPDSEISPADFAWLEFVPGAAPAALHSVQPDRRTKVNPAAHIVAQMISGQPPVSEKLNVQQQQQQQSSSGM